MVISVICKQQVKFGKKAKHRGMSWEGENGGKDRKEEGAVFLNELSFQTAKNRSQGLQCSHFGVWGLKEMIPKKYVNK